MFPSQLLLELFQRVQMLSLPVRNGQNQQLLCFLHAASSDVTVNLEGSLMAAALELGSLERALSYASELMLAKPRIPDSPKADAPLKGMPRQCFPYMPERGKLGSV